MNTCLNCNTKLTGNYCHNCGQNATVKRLTFKSFFTEFSHSIADLDSKFARTVKGLIVNPGRFIRNYLLGQRVPYVSPLNFMFIVLALNIAVMLILKKPAIEPVIIVGDSAVSSQIISILTNLVFLVFMIPFAIGMRIADRKRTFSFIEHYCFLLYIAAQTILIAIIIQLILNMFGMLLKGPNEGFFWFSGFTIYYIWSYFHFYDTSRKLRVIALIISYMIGLVILASLMIIIGKVIIYFIV